MADQKIYLIECTVPKVLTEEFMSLIPSQQKAIASEMMKGAIVSHSISQDHQRAWFVLSAQHKIAARRIMRRLPLTRFIAYEVTELGMHNEAHAWKLPSVSLN